MQPGRIPVTVVTGFLGAGKTTLVNRLLEAEPPGTTLVVENELGELAVDTALLKAPEDDVVVVAGGCACCTASGTFLSSLATAVRAKLRGDVPLRRVLIEASGAADATVLTRDLIAAADALGPLMVHGVVTVVDARGLPRQLERYPVAAAQLAAADVVVLNKLDLVAPGSFCRLRRLIRSVNPATDVICARRARVGRERVLGAAHDPDRVAHAASLGTQAAGVHGIEVAALEVEGELDLPRFQAWMTALVLLRGADLLRVKGVISLTGNARRYVFQGVRDVFDGTLGSAWGDEPRISRLVIIGHGLEQEALERSLRRCRTVASSRRIDGCQPEGMEA